MLKLLLALALAAPSALGYYGRHSTEATLTYHADADVMFPTNASVEGLNADTPERRDALMRIDEQVRHLMGTFQSDSFKKEFGYPGALGETYEIRFTGIHDGSAPGRKTLEYDFSGTVVFQKEAFGGHPTRVVPVRLPRSPDLIYKLGLVRSHGKDRNRCTDRDFNDESDFWYYWDPELPGCPLSGDDTDVETVSGHLERLANTRVSYPEYDRLYGDNGNGDEVSIAVFIGYIRAQNEESNKVNRRDEAMHAFRQVERDLNERGYSLTQRRDLFRLGPGGEELPGINFLRVYESDVPYDGRRLHQKITVLLADTDIDSKDDTFHRLVSPALATADIFLYDGHSGLGDNLDVTRLPDVQLDPLKYQLFIFNGCSTYPYLNGMYFRAKGGSRNLDIVTAGLPEFAESSGPNISAFLAPFLEARTLSYQKILSDVEDSNGPGSGTFLVGVKGDEDNVWHP